MTTDTRTPKSPPEPFVVQNTEEGYRVFSPLTPARQYIVKDDGEDITCTCPSFAENANIPNWRCNHIVAVIQFMDKQNPQSDDGAAGAAQPNGTPPPKEPLTPKKPGPKSGGAEAAMVIKRSVSPDGHVNSFSVEFSLPIGKVSSEEIKQQADRALKLQSEITGGFLKQHGHGSGNGNGNSRRANGNGGNGNRHGQDRGAATAQLLNIDAMDTKRGHSLFINVFVENQIAKLFGDEQKLGEALMAAGHGDQADNIVEGMQLNLPCRAITKRNGKYLNIERLLPATNGG